MPKKVAYLGPPGTFSEEAALAYDPTADLLPLSSIPAVASAVEAKMADEGVVPIENSLEGSVSATLDLLIHESSLLIRHELVLPVDHYLLVKPGTDPRRVRVIFSHPQALAQCRRFIERCFPKAEAVASLSTAAAVEEMINYPDNAAAAIGTRRAAEIYGAEVLAARIQDHPVNLTRFVVLALTDHEPTGDDKTSICFAVAGDDRPGTLVAALQEFAQRQINLTKIESRPSRQGLGKYIFLADLQGHRSDPVVAEALEALRAHCTMIKVFGSYPRFKDDL